MVYYKVIMVPLVHSEKPFSAAGSSARRRRLLLMTTECYV
jgi:hypothetical protein